MMTTAFLFPGQGSQFSGMGRDLYDAFPEARATIERADEVLGFALSDILFTAPDEVLRQTEFTQPAIYTHSMAVMAVLRAHGYTPGMMAGHSVGEFSALAAASAVQFEDGLRLVQRRGQLMSNAGKERSGTMAAILGMDEAQVRNLCEEASNAGHIVVPANFNDPNQIVISGDVRAVQLAGGLAEERGARRVIPLKVSGAFHSPLMEELREKFARVVQDTDIKAPQCPVYLNVTGRPTMCPDEIRAKMLRQLTSPVLWTQTLQQMHVDGAAPFVEVGVGRVLTGLVRRTLGRRTQVHAVGTAEQVASILASEQAAT